VRRRRDRTDDNQKEIVKELRKRKGVTIETGKDDLLVGYQGKTYWYEVKNPEVMGKDGKPRPSAVKPDQIRILENFTGHYRIIFTVEEILEDIGFNETGREA